MARHACHFLSLFKVDLESLSLCNTTTFEPNSLKIAWERYNFFCRKVIIFRKGSFVLAQDLKELGEEALPCGEPPAWLGEGGEGGCLLASASNKRGPAFSPQSLARTDSPKHRGCQELEISL
jgi:hypothetical protein